MNSTKAFLDYICNQPQLAVKWRKMLYGLLRVTLKEFFATNSEDHVFKEYLLETMVLNSTNLEDTMQI